MFKLNLTQLNEEGRKMNNHLKLLQWCIDNTDENFTANYNYGVGQSWVSGTHHITCIEHDDIDKAIARLEEVKAKHSPRFLAEKRKLELLAELERLNAELSS